jgi:hypothetical protein
MSGSAKGHALCGNGRIRLECIIGCDEARHVNQHPRLDGLACQRTSFHVSLSVGSAVGLLCGLSSASWDRGRPARMSSKAACVAVRRAGRPRPQVSLH